MENCLVTKSWLQWFTIHSYETHSQIVSHAILLTLGLTCKFIPHLVSKCAWSEGWMNSYWKRQVLMFYPLGKKLRKTLWGGGAGVHPLLLIRPRVKTRRYSPREQHSELPFFKRPQSMCLNTAIVFSNPQGIFSFSFYGLNASSVSICQGIATNEWQRAKVFPLSFILFLLPLRSLLGHVITMFWSGHLDNETVT